MFKYLKFSLAPLSLVASIYFASMGGNYIWYFFLGFSGFILIGDIIFGEDNSTPDYRYPWILNLMLYLNLPLLSPSKHMPLIAS